MKLSVMANPSPKHQEANRLETAVWTSKVLFLTVGIISTTTLLAKSVKFAFPCFLNLLHSSLPKLWTSVAPFLAPPYLFLAVNLIIMAIWKLNSNQFYVDDDSSFHVRNTTKSTYVLVSDTVSKTQDFAAAESEEGALWPIPLPEKEPVGEEEEFPDSIDATWKAITDSKSSAIEKILRKNSDSWERAVHEQALASLTKAAGRRLGKSEKFREVATPTRDIVVDSRHLKKSETFRESTGTTRDAMAKKEMRKSKTFRDVWDERDETFRYKVEAFIKMNYDQMRLQRKESEQQQCLDMVNVSF